VQAQQAPALALLLPPLNTGCARAAQAAKLEERAAAAAAAAAQAQDASALAHAKAGESDRKRQGLERKLVRAAVGRVECTC